MNASGSIVRVLGWVAALWVPTAVTASEVALLPLVGRLNGEMTLSLRVDGKDACQFALRDENNAAWPPAPACKFTLERGAKTLELEGRYKAGLLPRACKQTWRLRDLAPVTRSLYEPRLAFSMRLRQLVERAHGVAGIDLIESAPRPFGAAQIAAIEQRVGAQLPAELRDLYRQFGEFSFGAFGHRFASAGELGPIAPILRSFGDDAALADAELAPHFERAVFVLMEGGDGIGYIGYQPAPNALGTARAWFRFHQDGQTFSWLRDAAGRALDDEAALVRVLEVLLVERVFHPDEIEPDEARIDSARAAFALELRFQPGNRQRPFDLSLREAW